MSFCHYVITQFFLQADWDFVAKWASNAANKMKVWGQLLWAPPKAKPCSPPRCSPHDGSSAKLEAVNSPKCQTPVGMEHLELFGLGRRKADYLCWCLMGVRSPPTRKPAMGFLEMQCRELWFSLSYQEIRTFHVYILPCLSGTLY